MKTFIACVMTLVLLASAGFAQETKYSAPKGTQQIPSPALEMGRPLYGGPRPLSYAERETWLADIRHWRSERLIRIGYDGFRYAMPELKWTQSNFMQVQMMIEDRYFYDPVTRRYTVDRYLDDLIKRYGGIDSVLVWHVYPRLGIDDQNQHDMIHSMPGGIEGVRQMVADFHRRGVRVFFPMNMWDQGTRDPGKPWAQAFAELMREIGADGVIGDTQDGVPLAFSLAAEKAGHPLAFEPESTPADEALAWNLIHWGGYTYSFVPTVDRFKWLETRHMVHVTDRFKRDKTDMLQFAFFNGVGWNAWENIWGIWNGITPRDGEATRRIMTISRAAAPFLVSAGWEPLVPMRRYGIFASRWPLGDDEVWTIVNRGEYDVEGSQIDLPAIPGRRYFDLYHGVELTPEIRDGRATLSFPIEAQGFGALLISSREPEAKIRTLMDTMKQLSATPLASFSREWSALPQNIVPIAPTKPPATPPAGMVKIPAGRFNFRVMGVQLEGFNYPGVDVRYPWEKVSTRYHDHMMDLAPFWIDQYPVTNAQFKKFLEATNYRPQDDYNFLRDWVDGTYPKGWDNKPVTWVALEDARAYATWAGKRLPREWEWQYAAQGLDERLYPWGNKWDPEAVPVQEKGRTRRPPDAVDAHPKGASPFGVMDLVGNVWQWTDEFQDEHTRAAILRGGSNYVPQGSSWYFEQAYELNVHGHLLLMAPGRDRSGCVGFRCVMDGQ